MSRKLKFPITSDYAAKHMVVLCPAERVLGLYEQGSGIKAQRIAKKVKEWFTDEAKKHGWVGCRFVPEVQSTHGAGAILLNPLSAKITVKHITLDLPESEEG